MKVPNITLEQDARRIAGDALATVLGRLDIGPDDDPERVRAKVMRLRADASAWIEPRDALAAAAIDLYRVLADPAEHADTMDAYGRAKIGNIELKERIAVTISRALDEIGCESDPCPQGALV